MSGVWSFLTTVALLAGMATVIGLFNKWPAHETIGAAIVCLSCTGISVLTYRRWAR